MMSTQRVGQQMHGNADIVPALICWQALHGVTCLTRPEPNQYLPVAAVYEAIVLNRLVEWIGCRRVLRLPPDIATWNPAITEHKLRKMWSVRTRFVGPYYAFYSTQYISPAKHRPKEIYLPVWDYLRIAGSKLPRPQLMDRQTWRTQYRMLRIICRFRPVTHVSPIGHVLVPHIREAWVAEWKQQIGYHIPMDILIVSGELPPILMIPPQRHITHFVYIGDITACRLLRLNYTELMSKAAIECME